jgi:predicted lipoprotein with Yx(FWY)xxD motif
VRLLALCTFLAAMALVPAAGAVSANAPATVTARRSDYGRILFDGRGFALYSFARDGAGRSACSGPCAAAWPPYVVGARAHAGRGVDGSLLGTTRRRGGGLQVTYDGKPLYYYVGDRKPLQVLCQDVVEFGGRWLVVRPDGRTVR